MNFYLTSGTPDYMEKLIQKYKKEQMILLHGQGNSVVMHETNKKSVFATPRKFEVIDSSNNFEQRGHVVIHNIPVVDEYKPVFEEQLLKAIHHLKSDISCIAYRVLRPIKSEVYLIVTQWAGPASFDAWHHSVAYQTTLQTLLHESSSATQTIFTSGPYMTKYTAPIPE